MIAPIAVAAPAVDFNRDVRLILSENCFPCHGQDAEQRKGKLRLDTREGQRKEGVIVAGRPDESELILRIFSPHEDEWMPPPESHRTLSEAQKETLRRWVTEGAAFADHWAFIAPKRVEPPAVRDTAWPRNAIDRFVLARFESEGLRPSPEADRERWLRRVSFDLTGLPPTLAELDAFAGDREANAYEKVVERLLASPRYGERMAADWLDVARYADTHGYQMDRPRAMWPYRDWVINAFNRNQPYDQFLTEQIAGDLLPGATRDQRLATAFNRLHAQNEEGGIVDEEYRVAYVNDRVVTFGTAVLGLTLDCARCHDHKFDPITQRDYYSLAAFFQNIDEAGAISFKGFSDLMPPPVLKLPDPAAESQLTQLLRQIARQEEKLRAGRESAALDFDAWLVARSGDGPAVEGAVVTLDFDELCESGTPNSSGNYRFAKVVDHATLGDGVRGGAALLNGDNGFSLADVPVLTRGDAFSFSLWIRPAAVADREVVFHRSLAYTDAGSRGYELVLEHGRAAFGLHRHWPGSSLKVVTLDEIPAGEWTHLTLTYDGSSQAAGARIYVNGQSAAVEVVRDKLGGDITYDREKQPPLLIGHRFRDSGFKGGRVDEFRLYARELSPLEATHLAGRTDFKEAWQTPATQLTPAQRVALKDHYVRTVAPAVRVELDTLARLRREYVAAFDAVPEVMVMEEELRPRPAHVLTRGMYDQPGDEVQAGTPGLLPPMSPPSPRNRLGLAQWAVAPANPLTARVAVNRLWQQMFERGLVESADNFGVTGSTPTHPELLDWLATELVAGGWNVKALLRQIALSATYRQSSRATPELRARDPQNRLLARAPARRLTAEMLRDQALAVSGLLVERLGGPSVKPYQPPGLWEEIAMGKPKYEQGRGDELHRRSLYTFWKRTVPHPAMITFDAADRANCTVKRQATSTPLQALALLNDTQMVEAARLFGARMLEQGGATAASQARWGFRAATNRTPRDTEVSVLVAALEEQERLFADSPEAAEKLFSVGEAKPACVQPPARLAAATMVASMILNHDEAVMRR
ncbi:MAG: DUF1553 domain-containing protein [Opitutaceae bacterium]|nr:DUF1553 domain-containing protein [Opitutaceae bacterium]